MILLDVISFVVIILFLFIVSSRIDRRIYDRQQDEALRIDTLGVRSWGKEKRMYHRAESTPYMALQSLRRHLDVKSDDCFVDFGSGRGRVAFFIHKNFGIDVTGVELHDVTYSEAIGNKVAYMGKCYDVKSKLKFTKEKAEEYKIKKDDNIFFFFNPFDVSIFRKVMRNIEANSIKYNKTIKVILYYPTRPYRKLMMNKKHFTKEKIIYPRGIASTNEKFIIYEFNPNTNKEMN